MTLENHSSRHWAQLGLVLLGTMAGLVLCELILWVYPIPPGLLGEVESPRTYAPPSKPSWPLFHDTNFVLIPKQEKRRVVVIGDSFTWGDGVEAHEAYPAVLETLMGKTHPAAEIEVISWSRPGWNSWREWKSIEPQIPLLDPDLMIIGYCLNDAEPLNRRQLNDLRNAHAIGRFEPSSATSGWLYEHSRLGFVVFNALENRRRAEAIETYHKTLYEDGQSGWIRTREAMQNFAELSQERSIPVLLVMFPIFDSQLDDTYHYRDLHALVSRSLSGTGLEVLDLLPSYEGFDGRKLAVVPFSNAHPSALAHQVAAESIMERLDELSAAHGLW